MTDELTNQTQFAEDVILSGGDTNMAPPPLGTDPKKKTKKPLIIGGMAFVLLLMILSLAALASRPRGIQAPKPTPSLSPQEQKVQSEWQKRFGELEKQITTADPTDSKIAFPPIDFKLNLEDATARQQKR